MTSYRIEPTIRQPQDWTIDSGTRRDIDRAARLMAEDEHNENGRFPGRIPSTPGASQQRLGGRLVIDGGSSETEIVLHRISNGGTTQNLHYSFASTRSIKIHPNIEISA